MGKFAKTNKISIHVSIKFRLFEEKFDDLKISSAVSEVKGMENVFRDAKTAEKKKALLHTL
jgi:hypothetical protein